MRSAWLQQFPVPVEIHELSPDSIRAQTSSHAPALSLFSADIPIIVCNPLTTTLSDLFANASIPWTHSNTILVLTAPVPPAIFQTVCAAAPASLTVLSADPTLALKALHTLSTNPSSLSSVERYQEGFSESKVSDVSTTISRKLIAAESTDGNILPALRRQNALDLVSDSLNACRRAVKTVELETDRTRKGVSNLRSQMEEFRAKISPDVFGVEEKSEVKEALERAKQGVQETMNRLTAWRMVWKVDDIADTVNASIDRAWCRDLEGKVCKLQAPSTDRRSFSL